MDGSIWRPLGLATLSGLSTTIGGVMSVIHKPDNALMAGLLGSAIGVMATVSMVELIVKNAIENDGFMIMAATIAGALLYYVLERLLPKLELGSPSKDEEGQLKVPPAVALGPSCGGRRAVHRDASGDRDALPDRAHAQDGERRLASAKSANLMRLGLLMALTMTLHNLPEGFAVAFSSFTSLGPTMALAIAMHNIPEGVIIAAPIYAATGSRWKAIGLATASGLSEPLGALLALLLLYPFLNLERLQYMLAGTGGLMVAVCVIELWPEARACKNDRGMAIGIAIGSLLMSWTLYAGPG
mmetsp:Transcript_270/g.695  ORF Transcript_270/g.695 Transcript_270/m.695 type:complete len:299 (-) Transcript_270:336-1232(-)